VTDVITPLESGRLMTLDSDEWRNTHQKLQLTEIEERTQEEQTHCNRGQKQHDYQICKFNKQLPMIIEIIISRPPKRSNINKRHYIQFVTNFAQVQCKKSNPLITDPYY
jgi:hypothetical protein